MYTLTCYNQSGFFLFTVTLPTWTALCAYPRMTGCSYVFDTVK